MKRTLLLMPGASSGSVMAVLPKTRRLTRPRPERRAMRAGDDPMNSVLRSIPIALRALRVNKMRSALTTLGVVIGVAAVIATVAIGSGARERIEQQISSIGSNLIIVLPGS